ncbi:hypothetical protein BGY98DRAFT_1010812, partial [Russula aff. rugulosa BPL654]
MRQSPSYSCSINPPPLFPVKPTPRDNSHGHMTPDPHPPKRNIPDVLNPRISFS